MHRRALLEWLAASPLLALSPALRAAAAEGLAAPADALDVFDFEAAAAKIVPPAHWGYLQSGVDGNLTRDANTAAYAKWQLVPRRFVDVSRIDMSTSVLGTAMASPVILSPIGSLRALHAEADLGVARAAKVKVGPGTAKTAFLITSGDKDADGVDHSWQSVVQSKSGVNAGGTLGTYTESGMILLNRNPAAGGTSSDRTIISNNSNNGQGATILTAGYDATITPKLFATANVGVGLTTVAKTAAANGSHYQATEVNAEVGYKLYDNLTTSVQAAYAFLGPYYKNTASGKDPVDPYTTRINLTYAF